MEYDEQGSFACFNYIEIMERIKICDCKFAIIENNMGLHVAGDTVLVVLLGQWMGEQVVSGRVLLGWVVQCNGKGNVGLRGA